MSVPPKIPQSEAENLPQLLDPALLQQMQQQLEAEVPADWHDMIQARRTNCPARCHCH
jgi:hypothetical protein